VTDNEEAESETLIQDRSFSLTAAVMLPEWILYRNNTV